ncbi:hypothetical protein SLE2022_064830 [Rubroshorea leprosula]
MDDSCVVCADTLKWVAYGPCGHREVCSTCVIRLRFICEDRRCCLCKCESDIIFVTRALGDYTKVINDFADFPADPPDGQVGHYWYHEGTQAFFDDLDHYNMVKAMCKLSCVVCQKDELQDAGSKRQGEFKNIEQLKSHLIKSHRLLMCSLCLEGRKVFICEQKLYNKAQLNQHIRTGDSKVDGNESERGGFSGHPMCEFCQNPFYGDNELYLHMSTEHYTCHICQRQHPGQYDYFRNYDDMEIHFRQEHFLCEEEDCLTKKFVVFSTNSELKRHTAMEHGGHLSRSKRNATLQIPVSFQYPRSYEQNHQGGGHRSLLESSGSQFSSVTQTSLATNHAERLHDTSTSAQVIASHSGTREVSSIVGPFQSLATIDSEPSGHRKASRKSRYGHLEESSFPPLPVTSSSSQQKSRNNSGELAGSTLAARLHHGNNGTINVLNTSQAWPAVSHQPTVSASGCYQSRTMPNLTSSLSSSSSSLRKPARVDEHLLSSSASSSRGTACSVAPANFPGSSRNTSSTSKVSHSASASNLVGRGSFNYSLSSASMAQISCKAPTSSHPLLKVEDVQSANKALVEKVRAALEFDEDRYSVFKAVSSKYRQGLVNTEEYLANVYQFGLAHLVLELARLCPDARKQRELVESYNLNLRSTASNQNGLSNDTGQSRHKKGSRKGKEKCEDNDKVSTNGLTGCVKALQSNTRPSAEEAWVLFKDVWDSKKGKSKVCGDEQMNLNSADQSQTEPRTGNGPQSEGGACSSNNLSNGKGGNKPRKKVSKFLRNRLGDASAGVVSNPGISSSDPGPDHFEEKADESEEPPEGLPVRGVWRNGGGRRLLAMTRRDTKK